MSNPADSTVQNLLPVQAYFDVDGNFQTFIGQGQPFSATISPYQSGLHITNSTIDSTTIGATTPSTGVFTSGQVLASPSGNTDIANKLYVDSVASGLSWKQPFQVATTAPITLSGFPIVDTYQTVAGDRVLVKNQANAAQNGIYVASSGSWSYASDGDSWNEYISAIGFVEYGSQKGSAWYCSAQAGGTLGVTDLNWSNFSVAGTYFAGTGLTLAGYTFSITNTGVTAATYGSASSVPTIAVNAQGQITSATNTTIAISNTQVSGLGTMSTQDANSVAITGGTINGTPIGGTTAAAVTGTTITAGTQFTGPGIGLTGTATGLSIGGNAATATSATSATTATNLAGGAGGSLPYQSAAGATTFLSIGSNGQILTLAAGVPTWANAPATGVTSVSGTGTVSGITLSGTVTSSGSLTLGGSLDLSSPPAIGGATPAAITGTTITATSQFSGPGTGLSGTASSLSIGGNAATATSATSATTATNLAGGLANKIAYQTGAGTTSFIDAPVSASTYLGWNGSAFAWSTISAGLTVTDDTSTNATRYLTFTSATSGSITGINTASTELKYNPSSGLLDLSGATSAIRVQNGTTAQRPGTPGNGMIRYNTTTNLLEAYVNGVWGAITVTAPPVNSVAPVISGNLTVGSTLTTTNGTWTNSPTSYSYQWYSGASSIGGATSSTFVTTNSEVGTNITCQVTANNAGGASSPATSNSLGPIINTYSASYLIVGGGGGGGGFGGGGGAGGLLSGTTSLTIGTVYTATVGGGGNGGPSSYGSGTNGSNSSITGSGFTSITAIGGGAGAGQGGAAGNGGSGGGGAGTGGGPGTGTVGQGYDGGGSSYAGGCYYAGGGGGAGAAGGTSGGGVGVQSSITGSAVYYAGGGGGGSNGCGTGSDGSGAIGKGGYGGGNGGAGQGGSTGTVIFSIATGYYTGTVTGSPTVTTSGGNTIIKWTGTGTYTA